MKTDKKQLVVTIDDLSLQKEIRKAIKMIKGVGKITSLRSPKSDLDRALDDVAKGRIVSWSSVDELFATVLRK